MKVRSLRKKQGRLGFSALAVVGVLASLFVATPVSAASTGTGGLFVPATARILDTAAGVGGVSTPMPAGAYRTVKVAGVDGLPDDGSVAAISLVATVSDITDEGQLLGRPSAEATRTMLGRYGGIDDLTTSFSAILAVSAEGTVDLHAQTEVNLTIDVQGYYTSSTDGVAPGGFVPVNSTRIVDTRSGLGAPTAKIGPGQALDVHVTGLVNLVPSGASAVVVNLLAVNTTAEIGHLTPYPTGATLPATSLHYQPQVNTSVQAQVGLSDRGSFTIHNSGAIVDLIVDLQGYFTAAGEHGSSFTPASGRLYDSRTIPTGWFSAGETRSIPLDGLAGVPDVTFGVTAAVLTLTSLGTTSGTGRAIVWADGTSQPNTTAISSGERVTRSNTITVPIGANGAINLQNIGNETHYVLDLQGWYVDPEAAPAQETLTVEQIEQLSDQEIQDMLEASALKVENAQAAYAATATPEEYTAATAAYEEVAGELDRIIEAGGVSGLRAAVDAGEVVIDSPDIHSTDARCLTVHKWQLHTIGWILFAYGTFVTIAGLFASGTVIGLPLGAVAGAAGITLAATATHFIWRVDQLRWKSKRVCF